MAGLDPAISDCCTRPPHDHQIPGSSPGMTWEVARLYTTKGYPMAVGMRVCQSVSRW